MKQKKCDYFRCDVFFKTSFSKIILHIGNHVEFQRQIKTLIVENCATFDVCIVPTSNHKFASQFWGGGFKKLWKHSRVFDF